MVWAGVALRRPRDDGSWEYCVQRDLKREQWELPKGGAELRTKRRSTGCTDSSLFATARGELWEEAGVWLAWRPAGTYEWLSPQGEALPLGPEEGRSAFVCTELRPEDTLVAHSSRAWMTLERFAASTTRKDHVLLLRCWESRTLQVTWCWENRRWTWGDLNEYYHNELRAATIDSQRLHSIFLAWEPAPLGGRPGPATSAMGAAGHATQKRPAATKGPAAASLPDSRRVRRR